MHALHNYPISHLCMCDPGLNGKHTSYVNFEMPTRALMLLSMLKSSAHHNHDERGLGPIRNVCSLKNVSTTAAKLELDSSPDFIKYLLEIFSGLGAVTWFSDVAPELIILDPQWLIDSMACLIREHEGLHSELLDHLQQDKRAAPLFRANIVKRGFFPVKLLEYIWASGEEKYGHLNAKPKEINALKKILTKFGLICHVSMQREDMGSAQDGDDFFAVPALLTTVTEEQQNSKAFLAKLLKRDGTQLCTCRWDFSRHKWMPDCVFQRLVCTIVASGHVDNVMMAQNMAEIVVGDAKLLLCLHAEHWRIEAHTVQYEHCPHAPQWMLRLVETEMKKILQGLPVAHKVLLKTGGGDVALSHLRNAEREVGTTDREFLPAKPLKNTWLTRLRGCTAVCCSTQTRKKVATLTLPPTLEVRTGDQ